MKVGRTKLETAALTDPATLDTDAVVVPANTLLWMGCGYGIAVRKAAGESVENEAAAHAPADIGTVVVTGAGALSLDHVLHAVVCGQDLKTTESSVNTAVRSALDAAHRSGCRSVAVPLMECGGHGLEIHVAARTAVEACIGFCMQCSPPFHRLLFIESDAHAPSLYTSTLDTLFSSHG